MSDKSRNSDVAALQLASTIDPLDAEKATTDASRVRLQANRVGRFALLREIGTGGMGSVYAAYDEQLDRKVALKILHRAHAGNETQRLLTLREARAAARISHPNVIAVYEICESGGQIHIAMEYVDGSTLLRWQTAAHHDWREILAMYLQVGEALLAAHEADVVHRDFKPDNVLIGAEGRPRVVDFGLARVGWAAASGDGQAAISSPDVEPDARVSGRLTLPGIIAGTPGYMSPEQYRGGDVDSRSDQWSFCAALYEALYGHLPFSGTTLFEHAESVHGAPRPPPPGSKVPEEVHRALCRGLSPEPARRFPSMAELLAILRQEQSGDVAAGELTRQRLGRAFIALPIIAFIALQLDKTWLTPTSRKTVILGSIALTIVLLCGLWQRRVLLANRLHRNVWFLLLVSVVQNLLFRSVGLVMGLPIPTVFPFEMIGMAGSTAIVTTMHLRVFRWLPLLPLITAVASLFPQTPRRWLILVYPIVTIVVVLGWSRAARMTPRSKIPLSRPSARSKSELSSD